MQIEVSIGELALLLEALDSHEYWQLSDPANRNSGFVKEDEDDDEEIKECRRLHDRLDKLLWNTMRDAIGIRMWGGRK